MTAPYPPQGQQLAYHPMPYPPTYGHTQVWTQGAPVPVAPRYMWIGRVEPIDKPHRILRGLVAGIMAVAVIYGPILLYTFGPVFLYNTFSEPVANRVAVAGLATFLLAIFPLIGLIPTVVDLPFAWKVKNLRYAWPIVTHRTWRAFTWTMKIVFFLWIFIVIARAFTNPRPYF